MPVMKPAHLAVSEAARGQPINAAQVLASGRMLDRLRDNPGTRTNGARRRAGGKGPRYPGGGLVWALVADRNEGEQPWVPVISWWLMVLVAPARSGRCRSWFQDHDRRR
jgi:hypothetical protein